MVMETKPDDLLTHLHATLQYPWAAPSDDLIEVLERADAARGAPHLWPQPDLGALWGERFARVLGSVLTGGFKEPVTWSWFQRVHGEATGLGSGFRRGDARCGEERYGGFEGLEGMWVKKLEADARDEAHAVAKAVRGWLDVGYVHPFEDGNARASVLLFARILVDAGLPLPALQPLMRYPRRAGDVGVYERLLRAVALGIARRGEEERCG